MKFKDLISVPVNNEIGNYFTTKEVFKKNILIQEQDYLDEEGEYKSRILLHYYNENDAKTYYIEDAPDSDILIYVAIGWIIDLSEELPIEDFLNTIERLSIGYTYASSQLTAELFEETYTLIVANFRDFIANLPKEIVLEYQGWI